MEGPDRKVGYLECANAVSLNNVTLFDRLKSSGCDHPLRQPLRASGMKAGQNAAQGHVC